MATNRLNIFVDGELVDPTSVTTGDSGGSYGVRRVDDLYDIVVVEDLEYTLVSTGIYDYEFTEPEDDLSYEWAATIVHSGTTYYVGGVIPTGITTTTVVLPTTATYYSSQAEVLRVMGTMAEALLLEDATSKSAVWTDLLQDATDTIKMYVMQHYDPSTLNTNKWIRRRATILVAQLLSTRRANPPLYTTRVDRVYEELDMIRDNRMRIPGATVRHFQGPIVRNYDMQKVFHGHQGRVVDSKSTRSGHYSGESLALEPYVYYGCLI